MIPPPPRLRPLTDVSAADWVVASVGEFASGVKSLLPGCFKSYARILHPAWPTGDALTDEPTPEPVTWETVAAVTGRQVHSRAQFDALIGAERDGARDYEPDVGELPANLSSALCEVLAEHTATRERCWFCLWDGWGWIGGSPSVGVFMFSEGAESPREAPIQVPPAFASEVMDGPRVSMPGRDYILFEGPLEAADELGWRRGELLSAAYPELDIDPEEFERQSSSLFWPQDHSWCVATEIDLDSTYVGGSQGLVAALLADRRFEAWPARLDDRIDSGGDEVND